MGTYLLRAGIVCALLFADGKDERVRELIIGVDLHRSQPVYAEEEFLNEVELVDGKVWQT